jgi:hypothetical protein
MIRDEINENHEINLKDCLLLFKLRWSLYPGILQNPEKLLMNF